MNTKIKQISAVETLNGIEVYLDGEIHTIYSTHPFFKRVIDALDARDIATLLQLFDISHILHTCSNGTLKYIKDKLYAITEAGDREIPPKLGKAVIDLCKKGYSPMPVIACLKRLLLHPKLSSIESALTFVIKGNLSITPDGYFLGYKGVASNYLDVHSKTYLNKPGVMVRMRRHEVNMDRTDACGAGLHVGSLGYAMRWGQKCVAVLIDPLDVGVVPEAEKLRTCGYFVMGDKLSRVEFPPIITESEMPARPACPPNTTPLQLATGLATLEEEYERNKKLVEVINRYMNKKASVSLSTLQKYLKSKSYPLTLMELKSVVTNLYYYVNEGDLAKAQVKKIPQFSKDEPGQFEAEFYVKLLQSVNKRLAMGEEPTLKQIKSSFKDVNITVSQLATVLIQMGFLVTGKSANSTIAF